MKRYNNYHKHDHISSIFGMPDSNSKNIDYVLKTVDYNHTNYFTTNHGTMGDIFEAKTLCDQYNLRCLAGIEGYIVPDPYEKDKSNYHIVIIPRTNSARRKLNLITSRASTEGFYYRPRIFPQDLLKLDPSDIYITTACVAGILREQRSIDRIFVPLVEHFGRSVFLEVQNHPQQVQIDLNNRCLEFASKYNLGLIAANDSHYIIPSDTNERDGLLKGKRISYDDEDAFVLDFPDYDTMYDRFLQQGILSNAQIREAMDNTLIFDDCEPIDINKEIKMPSIYKDLSPEERVKLLRKIVYEKFEEIKKKDHITDEELPAYLEGINYELQIVEDTNEEVHTADYFLFNTKNVDLAVNKYGGVLTRTGRGSCGSFYINRILGMTQLDRFRINLPIFPDRFASTARLIENRALPDIDYNVKEQEPFVKASRELLGEYGCYPMIAYGTMQLSEAFRNVCRSHEVPHDDYNEIAKNVEAYEEDPRWMPYIEEAKKYVGTIVSSSVHPCAHILSDKDLREEYGVVKIGDAFCVMITSQEADEYKVLKNDYLVVKVWGLIADTFKAIGSPIIDLQDMLDSIRNDNRVWDLFKNGITCTLNQVDSDNGTKQAKQYGIHSFEDGAFIAAAIRPSFDSWRDRFLSRQHYTTGSSILDNVLSQTHGYILFQENLMQYFDWLGVTPAESIGLIKKISKKKIKPEDFEKLEVRLKEHWVRQTGSTRMFKETWDMIQSCMSYGFCSAHAAATSGDMCYGAYLKVHYPCEYYCVALNNYKDDAIRTKKLIDELKYFNISLSGIKFRKSLADYSADVDNRVIYKGVSSIKYLNTACAESLYTLKDKQYDSFIDLLADISDLPVDSRQLQILIELDFFSEFGEIEDLKRRNDLFNAYYGKKQIKKEKAFIEKIDFDLLRKYSAKETPKMFMGLDSIGLLRELTDSLPHVHTTLMNRIGYQLENLGYIDIVDKKYRGLCVVTDINLDHTPRILLYPLANGKMFQVKIPKKIYELNPLVTGQIIHVFDDGCYKKPKNKLVNGKWVKDGSEKEWWIDKYRVERITD